MAPEIYLTFTGNIKGYDWRVDWWALGKKNIFLNKKLLKILLVKFDKK